MDTIALHAAPGQASFDRRERWHRRVYDAADLPGALTCVVPLLLGAFLAAGVREAEIAIYGICLLIALPKLAPFVMSTRRHPANIALIALFVALGLGVVAASQQEGSNVLLQWKSLAATAIWASIYIIVFANVQSPASVLRFARWVHWTCVAIAASVYLSAILHLAGVPFGEVLEFSDGSFRAFGPLGDQASFIVILPALVSLAQSRPLSFGLFFGALLLTATRGALLSLTIGVAAYLFLFAWSRAKVRGLMWGIASICVAGLIIVSPLSRLVLNRIGESPTDRSYSFRWTAIVSGIRLVGEHPLFGVGFNQFGDRRHAVAEDWFNVPGTDNGLSRTANQYVQTATDGGLLAAFSLVMFVSLTLRNAFRTIAWKQASGELVGTQLWLIAVLVGNQGALWLLADASSGFFVLALAALAARAIAVADAPALCEAS